MRRTYRGATEAKESTAARRYARTNAQGDPVQGSDLWMRIPGPEDHRADPVQHRSPQGFGPRLVPTGPVYSRISL